MIQAQMEEITGHRIWTLCFTSGTVCLRDTTYDAVRVCRKTLLGFGGVISWLSYQEVVPRDRLTRDHEWLSKIN